MHSGWIKNCELSNVTLCSALNCLSQLWEAEVSSVQPYLLHIHHCLSPPQKYHWILLQNSADPVDHQWTGKQKHLHGRQQFKRVTFSKQDTKGSSVFEIQFLRCQNTINELELIKRISNSDRSEESATISNVILVCRLRARLNNVAI